MSGPINKDFSDHLSSFHPHPTMSHVQRIVLDFENRRLLRAEFGGFYERPDLYSGANPMLRLPRPELGRPLPVHSVPDVTTPEKDSEKLGFYEQVPDHVMYRGGEEVPKHVEREMLKRQHSLVFECNWW